jgi:hypothetical protein
VVGLVVDWEGDDDFFLVLFEIFIVAAHGDATFAIFPPRGSGCAQRYGFGAF